MIQIVQSIVFEDIEISTDVCEITEAMQIGQERVV